LERENQPEIKNVYFKIVESVWSVESYVRIYRECS